MLKIRRWAPWGILAVLPMSIFLLLDQQVARDPVWQIPNGHFLIVTLTALLTFFVAGLMVIAASQLRDARVVFLSLSFLAIAGIFAVHGMTTPGALVQGMNPWVGFSARLSLFAGAFFFMLSTLAGRPRFNAAVVRRQWLITTGFLLLLALYATVAITDAARDRAPAAGANAATTVVQSQPSGGYGSYGQHADHTATAAAGPDLGNFAILASDPVSALVTVATLSMLALVIVHYRRLYRLARVPLIAGFLVSASLLFQSQVIMFLGETWHASWWIYHVLMLGAFAAAVIGLVVEYRVKGNIGVVVAGLLVRDTLTQLQRGYTDVIVALVAAVEAKDQYTRGHTQRVTRLAVQIGEDLRLPVGQLRTLAQAAILHDIGKIGVPDSILSKPGPLTAEEFAVVKEHPDRGYQIVKDIRSLQGELSGIRRHHEKLDGSGYPDGVSGDDIPLIARIITVADMFDALTSERSYRPAWTQQQAFDLIDGEAGTKLDVDCVAALHRVVANAAHAVHVPFAETRRGMSVANAVQLEHGRSQPVPSPRHP
ncbi:MAG TPA: HD-GYP domain-containing protein [Thermomicrobiales bacterium]|nr:HD-GYP domain-containing protein [Thermomicrobiales bacterium]